MKITVHKELIFTVYKYLKRSQKANNKQLLPGPLIKDELNCKKVNIGYMCLFWVLICSTGLALKPACC